jgi:hypothetical protein
MNWRKSFYLSFIPLFAFLAFLLYEKPQGPDRTGLRTLASLTTQKRTTVRKKIAPRVAEAVRGRVAQDPYLRNRIPQSVEVSLVRDSSINVTKGYELLRDVGVVTVKDYRPEFGEILKESDGMVYFRTNYEHRHTPVAISRRTGSLFPVSQVLHLRGVTAVIRDSLLGQGYTQYYYQAPLKFLSIKSKNGHVLSAYNDLTQKGYKVELEVLRPTDQNF